jgi:hypothetical protein
MRHKKIGDTGEGATSPTMKLEIFLSCQENIKQWNDRNKLLNNVPVGTVLMIAGSHALWKKRGAVLLLGDATNPEQTS